MNLEERKQYTEAVKEPIFELLERGIEVRIYVHKNTTPALRELAEKGAQLLYIPIPEPPYGVTSLIDGKHVAIEYPDGSGRYEISTSDPIKSLANFLFRKLHKRALPIPKQEVENIFEMIDRGQTPKDIMNYLSGIQ